MSNKENFDKVEEFEVVSDFISKNWKIIMYVIFGILLYFIFLNYQNNYSITKYENN
jgi:hypothetical protein